jgi:hypothetical protein
VLAKEGNRPVRGRKHYRSAAWFALLLMAATGCPDSLPPSSPSADPPVETRSRFDPATAGTILGQVLWVGDLPTETTLPYGLTAQPPNGDREALLRNPNAPVIDPRTKGVADAVVYLRGIDAATARRWDHPSVRIEMRDLRFHVFQGGLDAQVGFVRRGDSVEMVSRDREFHSLRARGAAWFSLSFPDPDDSISRPLGRAGVVEFSSGTSYFWMRAYLLVCEHPYYTRTDAAGRFTLAGVPPGEYQLVCWMPNWREARHIRDQDWGGVTRLYFQPPALLTRPINLGRGEQITVGFSVGLENSANAETKRAP